MTTPVLSPLNQSLDVETSSLFSHLHYVSPPVVPRAHTPGMALVERVGKLSIEGSDIRRCLFPLTSTELKRNTGHLTCPADSITLGVHDTRICRKSNKCRLRRLWLPCQLSCSHIPPPILCVRHMSYHHTHIWTWWLFLHIFLCI